MCAQVKDLSSHLLGIQRIDLKSRSARNFLHRSVIARDHRATEAHRLKYWNTEALIERRKKKQACMMVELQEFILRYKTLPMNVGGVARSQNARVNCLILIAVFPGNDEVEIGQRRFYQLKRSNGGLQVLPPFNVANKQDVRIGQWRLDVAERDIGRKMVDAMVHNRGHVLKLRISLEQLFPGKMRNGDDMMRFVNEKPVPDLSDSLLSLVPVYKPLFKVHQVVESNNLAVHPAIRDPEIRTMKNIISPNVESRDEMEVWSQTQSCMRLDEMARSEFFRIPGTINLDIWKKLKAHNEVLYINPDTCEFVGHEG